MPTVSIVLPTYNRARLLSPVINSVLNQSYMDWELIVVDDGSEDETGEIIKGFTDDRIRYIYQVNTKSPGARNTGIRASNGRYVKFLDSDDLLLPSNLEEHVKKMEAKPELGLTASGWEEVDRKFNSLGTQRPWLYRSVIDLTTLLYSCPFPPSAAMVKREWLLNVGMFDPQQFYVEDWDLWLRLAHSRCVIEWIPQVLWQHMTRHSAGGVEEGSRAHHTGQMIDGLFRLLEKYYNQPDLSKEIQAQKSYVFANANLDAAIRSLGNQADSKAVEYLCAAISLNPDLLKGTPPLVMQSLASAALSDVIHEKQKYPAQLLNILEKVNPLLFTSKRKLRGLILATTAFDDYKNEKNWQARLHAINALGNDPAWFMNRGLLKILFNVY